MPGRLCATDRLPGVSPSIQVQDWPPPEYRCIFNTETKRYNPRLIGKLHIAVSLFDTNRGKTPNRGKPPLFSRQSLWLHSAISAPRRNRFAFTSFSATFNDPPATTFSAFHETKRQPNFVQSFIPLDPLPFDPLGTRIGCAFMTFVLWQIDCKKY